MVFLEALCWEYRKTEAPKSLAVTVLAGSCPLESEPPSEGLGVLTWNILVDGTVSWLVG